MSDGVDAVVHLMQTPILKPAMDGVPVDPFGHELPIRHAALLPRRDPRRFVEFAARIAA